MRSELEKEADRSIVLARFVSGLSEDDEQVLRALLGRDAAEAQQDGPGGRGDDGGRP
jgi:hypothetical protein